MARLTLLLIFLTAWLPMRGMASSAEFVATPYAEQQKIVFDFYFDDPQKINPALYWLKGLVDPLMAEPYNLSPDDIDIKVILHGTEVVALAKHNYPLYQKAVQRMRYYAALGVEFRLCAIAARDYDYALSDLQDFVQLVPSGIAELAHWQSQGYVLITPKIQDRRFAISEIR
jgi:intracellular sulfur oxidation DsrE/DsrF family protein